MTIDDLIEALSPLVVGDVYTDLADLDSVMPLIILQQVGGRPNQFVEGAAPLDKHSRLQISVLSQFRREANHIINQIENLVVQAPFLADIEGRPIWFSNSDTNVRGVHQDFSFLFSDT